MNDSFSYRHIDFVEPVKKAVNTHLRKVAKLLEGYAPDLINLKGHFDKHPRRTEFTCTLNLSLPTGTLHASAAAVDPENSARGAFCELETQIKKHRSLVRKDFQWKRKRVRIARALA